MSIEWNVVHMFRAQLCILNTSSTSRSVFKHKEENAKYNNRISWFNSELSEWASVLHFKDSILDLKYEPKSSSCTYFQGIQWNYRAWCNNISLLNTKVLEWHLSTFHLTFTPVFKGHKNGKYSAIQYLSGGLLNIYLFFIYLCIIQIKKYVTTCWI